MYVVLHRQVKIQVQGTDTDTDTDAPTDRYRYRYRYRDTGTGTDTDTDTNADAPTDRYRYRYKYRCGCGCAHRQMQNTDTDTNAPTASLRNSFHRFAKNPEFCPEPTRGLLLYLVPHRQGKIQIDCGRRLIKNQGFFLRETSRHAAVFCLFTSTGHWAQGIYTACVLFCVPVGVIVGSLAEQAFLMVTHKLLC